MLFEQFEQCLNDIALQSSLMLNDFKVLSPSVQPQDEAASKYNVIEFAHSVSSPDAAGLVGLLSPELAIA